MILNEKTMYGLGKDEKVLTVNLKEVLAFDFILNSNGVLFCM